MAMMPPFILAARSLHLREQKLSLLFDLAIRDNDIVMVLVQNAHSVLISPADLAHLREQNTLVLYNGE